MFPGQCGNTAFFFKSQPDQFHFEFRGIVFPGKSFFSAHEVSTCKISGCLSYRILDSGPDGTQTTLTFYLALADAWLLVNEQQPVYQFRIRNQYNGMTTEWNSVARDKVIEVIKMQPETAEFRVLVPSAPEPAANARQLISEIEGLREAIGKLYPANTDVRRIARNSGWMHVYDDTNAKMNFADNARNTPYLDAFVTQLHLFLTDDRE
ncbi:hypothetical protein [Citrobacter freundii]|uniref:hypothetical protein n=1 Tax=Citrobacter freundii TaxID=546 RepID=UPI002E0E4719